VLFDTLTPVQSFLQASSCVIFCRMQMGIMRICTTIKKRVQRSCYGVQSSTRYVVPPKLPANNTDGGPAPECLARIHHQRSMARGTVLSAADCCQRLTSSTGSAPTCLSPAGSTLEKGFVGTYPAQRLAFPGRCIGGVDHVGYGATVGNSAAPNHAQSTSRTICERLTLFLAQS
jgi:hypothetical protein